MTEEREEPRAPWLSAEGHRRKADQEWEMAGLARRDGDRTAEEQHTRNAREHDQLAREAHHG